jgi:hypothetical protein
MRSVMVSAFAAGARQTAASIIADDAAGSTIRLKVIVSPPRILTCLRPSRPAQALFWQSTLSLLRNLTRLPQLARVPMRP